MKLLRSLAILLAMISLVACSSGDGTDTITGVFVDSTVQGLGYECGDDPVRHLTNADGEFTCNVGDDVRFYLGQILLGGVLATSDLEVVTPAMLVGASLNELIEFGFGGMGGAPSDALLSSIYMGAVLQSLDEDGDPSNGIVIPEAVHGMLLEAGVWEMGDEEESEALGQLFGLLEDLEVEIVDPEEAFFHLLAESAKLLQGQYSGSLVEDEETIRVDLFIFEGMDGPGGLERAAELGPEGSLRGHLVASAGDGGEPLEIEIGAPFVEADDQLLVIDYALDGISIRVFDFIGILDDEVEPIFDEETGALDLSPLAPYLLHTVALEKVAGMPGVTLRDVGEFLAQTPEGNPVPEFLEEMYDPRVDIYAMTPREMGEPEQGQGEGSSLWVGGHAQKVDIEGYFDEFMIDWGHAALASLDDESLVYSGRAFYYYIAMVEGEFGEFATWGDVTVTVGVDGSVAVSLTGDDGSAFADDTLEIEFAGVGVELD